MPKTMVGVALLTGLRRGELFALRWGDFDEHAQCVCVRQAVYEGTFSTPKTAAGAREIPLSSAAVALIVNWRGHARRTDAER
jgi:integrase